MSALWTTFRRPSERGDDQALALAATDVRVTFDDGIEAIDAASGLWNVPLGYGRPEIADAVARALRDASYLTLFRRAHPAAIEVSERLIAYAAGGFRGVVHSTSGAAANDAMMKLVRQYWSTRGRPERSIVVGLRGSYHGLTYGAQALSGDALGQRIYGVDQRAVRHIAFDDDGADLAALVRREGHRIAAIVLEPVLGSGAYAVPTAFLDAVFAAAEQHGFLVVADEVATGFGRTGRPFASGTWSRPADAMVVSKALSNGSVAAAAVLVGERIDTAFRTADQLFVHGETQAGTPMACAAILATLDLIDALDAPAGYATVSARLDAGLAAMMHPHVVGARGTGAFRAIELRDPLTGTTPDAERVTDLVENIRRRGAIVHPGPGCLQLVPPAILTDDEFTAVLAAVDSALDEFGGVG